MAFTCLVRRVRLQPCYCLNTYPEVATLKGRPTTGPKGRKYIARGEAPGREAKGNQPRRGDTKGRIIGLKRLLFSQNVVLLRLRKRIILPPLRGLSYGITFTGGFTPRYILSAFQAGL